MLKLILDGLEERGNAMMVVAYPAAGEDAIVTVVNGLFARMVCRPADTLTGYRIGGLRGLAAVDDWNALIGALRTRTPLDLDMKLTIGGHETWFGFGLTFKTERDSDVTYAMILGRDITEARRRTAREAQSQRFLVSIFARINTPVLLVQENGTIVMSNPTFHRMIGYAADEVAGRNVAEFTLPECCEAVRMARAAVPVDGSYELEIVMLAKSGARTPVWLRSSLLNDAQDGGLRVTTLIPYIAPPGSSGAGAETMPAGPDAVKPRPRSVGQVQAVSLAALRDAVGEDWPRVSSRAMLLAEHIMRRHLDPADVAIRADDDGFIIWFDSADEHHNSAVLTAATREIRLRFLCDFGDEMSRRISSVTVGDSPSAATRDVAAAPESKIDPLGRLRHGREHVMLLRDLRDAQVAQVDPVTDRDGRSKPVVLVDLPIGIRCRLSGVATPPVHEVDHGVDLDVVRLGLATRELASRLDDSKVLVPISWLALSSPERRWSIDEHLGTVEHRLRSRLAFVVSGVPPLRTDARWHKVVDPLCRQFGDVGLMVELAKTGPEQEQETKLREWSIDLLVIDATEQDAAAHEGYFGLITLARRRAIDVLVRVAAAAAIADWRELGSTLFAGTPGAVGRGGFHPDPRP